MFWTGLIVGLLLGTALGMLAVGLCVVGSDRHYDRIAGTGTQRKEG